MENLYKNIILEGPDGSGKSYIGKKLEALTGRTTYHAGGVPRSIKMLLSRADDIYLKAQKPDFIFDRHPAISEQVYGPIMRNSSRISMGTSHQMLKALNPLILYLRPTDEQLRESREFAVNDKNKPDHKPKAHRKLLDKHYPKIIEEYDWLMHNLAYSHQVVQIDPRNKPLVDSILRNIARTLPCVG